MPAFFYLFTGLLAFFNQSYELAIMFRICIYITFDRFTSGRPNQPKVDQWPKATQASAVKRPDTANQGK